MKKGLITLLYKKDDPLNPLNYRPIIHERNKLGYFYENPKILKLVLLLLLLSGDIERNPGPVMTYTQTLQIIQNKENYLKCVHLNFQDIRKKQIDLKNLSNDLGLNTVLAITET